MDSPGRGLAALVDSSNCGGSPDPPLPELLMRRSDTGWGELAAHGLFSMATRRSAPSIPRQPPGCTARSTARTPERFAATLANPIMTTPAVGTNETYTFSDAATAPYGGPGGDDRFRGDANPRGNRDVCWLHRGSNGTTPAAHAAGVVSVSGRRPIGIPPTGILPSGYTTSSRRTFRMDNSRARSVSTPQAPAGPPWPGLTAAPRADWTPDTR